MSLFVHQSSLALEAILELILVGWLCIHDLANSSELVLLFLYHIASVHIVCMILHL